MEESFGPFVADKEWRIDFLPNDFFPEQTFSKLSQSYVNLFSVILILCKS